MNEECEKSRQAFGAWCAGHAFTTSQTENAWAAWQASRKQAVEEAARIAENQYEVWDEGIAAGNEIAAAIRAMQKV